MPRLARALSFLISPRRNAHETLRCHTRGHHLTSVHASARICVRAFFLTVMAERGTPTIYYGDEIGLTINAAAELPACGSRNAAVPQSSGTSSSGRRHRGNGRAQARRLRHPFREHDPERCDPHGENEVKRDKSTKSRLDICEKETRPVEGMPALRRDGRAQGLACAAVTCKGPAGAPAQLLAEPIAVSAQCTPHDSQRGRLPLAREFLKVSAATTWGRRPLSAPRSD